MKSTDMISRKKCMENIPNILCLKGKKIVWIRSKSDNKPGSNSIGKNCKYRIAN
jgi:hypothetical protein